MCGRAAQTVHAAHAAAQRFGASPTVSIDMMKVTHHHVGASSSSSDHHDDDIPKEDGPMNYNTPRDNFNMSPGMDAVVMWMNEDDGSSSTGSSSVGSTRTRSLRMSRKRWGLITKTGTPQRPLYRDDKDIIKMCFDNLCYNARSDTLFAKPTFSRLALQGKSCVVALDGYFEWKTVPKIQSANGKQPYFVYRNNKNDDEGTGSSPLLMAGLWTRVATGIPEAPYLDTFCTLTTEANPQIAWLHHRMPICLWDMDLARLWLNQPSEAVLKRIDDAARHHKEGFAWHKVTPEMSKLKFRGREAVEAMREATQSVSSFFGTATAAGKEPYLKPKPEPYAKPKPELSISRPDGAPIGAAVKGNESSSLTSQNGNGRKRSRPVPPTVSKVKDDQDSSSSPSQAKKAKPTTTTPTKPPISTTNKSPAMAKKNTSRTATPVKVVSGAPKATPNTKNSNPLITSFFQKK